MRFERRETRSERRKARGEGRGWLRRGLALALCAGWAAAGHALTSPPTIANNTTFGSGLNVGQSRAQTVTLTLNAASAIKSIALATGTAASLEYTLNSVTGCTVDGTTVNPSGTVCSLSITFAPLYAGSTISPRLSRNAQLLYTDGSGNVTAYGLSGSANTTFGHVSPGTLALYAGLPYTVAGTSPLDNSLGPVTGGYAGAGGAATSATFDFAPYSAIYSQNVASNATQPMALDSQGNLYVIDLPNYVIRKIDNSAQHLVTTIAGTAKTQGYTGNNGPATSATLNNPHALTLDAAGNIYFIDSTTNYLYNGVAQVIRRIDAVTGTITAVYGQNFTGTYDSADGGGTCNLNTAFTPAVYACGDGGLATYAYLNGAYSLVLDSSGNFYLSGTTTPYIRKIAASTGIITTVATTTTLNSLQAYGGMTLASDGNLYLVVVDQTANSAEIKRFNPPSSIIAAVSGTNVNPSGGNTNCYLAKEQLGIPAANFQITGGSSSPGGDLSADASGNLYVSGNFCTAGVSNTGTPGIARLSIPNGTVFAEVVANAYPYGGTATTNYNAYYNYAIAPVTAIPDNAGNLYFTTYNQIAVLQGSAAAVDFGSENDYVASATKVATFSNLGNANSAPPTYSFASGTNFILAETGDTNACDALNYVNAGSACNLDISFDPIAVGALSDTLSVNNGSLLGSVDTNSGTAKTSSVIALGGGLTVSVTGVGIAEPRFSIAPSTLAFGNQTVKTTSAAQTFTISNTGTGSLTINSVYPDGTNGFTNYATVPSQSTCSTTSSTVLAPGGSCTVAVTFTPQTATSLPANFYVADSIAFGDVATLSGTGVAAVTGTPMAALSPSPVVFANTAVNTPLQASSQTVMLNNAGSATLTGITPTITGTNANQFSIDASSTCGSTLAAGGSCTLVIDFAPTTYGLLTATLSVSDNAASSPQTDGLAGIGIRGSTGQMQFYPSQMTLFAGQVPGTCSESGIPGPVASANLCTPAAVAVDQTGNTYIVDEQYNTVLKVDTSGNVTVFAGKPNNSSFGTFSGDNGQAASAGLNQPVDVAIDAAGNVYISDSGNGRIRKVNAITGVITTFAGGGAGPYFVPGPATSAAIQPEGINFDLSGNLYIAYANQNLVIEVTPAGAATVFAGSQGTTGVGLSGYSGDTGPATSAKLSGPNAVAADSAGNVYISDFSNCVIRKVNSGGTITTFAGNGTCGGATNGPALQSPMLSRGLSTDLAGDLIVSNGTQIVSINTVLSPNNITLVGGGGNTTGTYPILATSASFPRGTYVARVDNNGNVLIPGQIGAFSFQVVQVGPVGDLQFGSQTVNTPASLGVTIENTGNGTLQLNGLTVATVTGTNASDFALTSSTCGYMLQPAATCVLTVTFTPSNTGLRTASLAVPAGSSTQTVILQGTGAAATTGGAIVTANPTSLTFPNTTVNTNATPMPITLTNVGTVYSAQISFPASTSTAFTIGLGTCSGVVIAPGASCVINVGFGPQAAITYNATGSVQVSNNGNGGTTPPAVSFALNGTGVAAAAPAVTLTPIAFPNTPEGTTSAPLSATLSNTGNATLTINTIAIVGSNFALASGGSCGSTLAAGASCTIAVTFSPVAPTSYSAMLSVTDNATGSPHTSALTGTGSYVKPTVTLLPSPFVYASTTVGQKSAAQAFTLTNTGTSPFSFTQGLSDSIDFAITGTTCGTTLTPGNSCTVSVVFQPQSATTLTCNLLLADYGDALNAVAALSGTGVAVVAPTLTPVASLSPTSLSFPNTTQGATATALSTTLSNTGTGPLAIASVALGGANAADFALSTNNCGTTLAAGSSCTIFATFTPAGASTYTATITVTDNSAVTTQVATLTGTGVAVATDFSLTSNTPAQTVNGGSPAQYSVAVTPIGGSFNGVITFAVTGLPAGSVATFAPATLTPGSRAATSTLTVSTVQLAERSTRPFPWYPAGLGTMAAAFLLPLWWRKRKLLLRGVLLRSRVSLIALALLLSGAALTLSGCGAGFTLPAKSYTLTVTGTSGSTTHSTTVALTVQ